MKYQSMNKIIKKHNWKLYITRQIDLLTLIVNARSNSDELVQKLGFGIKVALHLSQKGMVEYYRDQDQQQEFIKNIQKLVFRNPEKFLDIFLEAKKINRQMLNQIKGVNQFTKLAQGKSSEELGLLFENLYGLFLGYFAPCVVIPYFVGVAEEQYGIESKNEKIKNVKAESKKLRAISHYINFRNTIIKNLFLIIAHKKNIDSNIIDLLSPEEITRLCKSQFVPSKRLIKKRRDFIYIREKNKETLIFDDAIAHKIRFSVKEEIFKHNPEIIKGRAGYKGVINGMAKIIFSEKDFSKFKGGDVLVTINSNPSLMPVIKKCSAIISDEGGITCHAAIIARELKIPCIIGTKIATKVLKDGDLVEVDADRGIVKIIN